MITLRSLIGLFRPAPPPPAPPARSAMEEFEARSRALNLKPAPPTAEQRARHQGFFYPPDPAYQPVSLTTGYGYQPSINSSIGMWGTTSTDLFWDRTKERKT